MSTSTPVNGDYFTRALAAVAILGPILLVIIAGTLPEGEGMRGDLIVDGHIFIAATLATALLLRVAYGMGFSRARRLLTASPNRSLTA